MAVSGFCGLEQNGLDKGSTVNLRCRGDVFERKGGSQVH